MKTVLKELRDIDWPVWRVCHEEEQVVESVTLEFRSRP